MPIYRPTSTPDPINHELLQEQLAQLGDIGLSKDSISWRVDIFESGVTNAQVQAVIDAHDGTQKTDNQKIEESAEIALANGKLYLRKQLLNASPNVGEIYTTIKTAVDANPYLLQMVTNQIALIENSHSITVNLITPTPADRMRYILAVQQIIALLS